MINRRFVIIITSLVMLMLRQCLIRVRRRRVKVIQTTIRVHVNNLVLMKLMSPLPEKRLLTSLGLLVALGRVGALDVRGEEQREEELKRQLDEINEREQKEHVERDGTSYAHHAAVHATHLATIDARNTGDRLHVALATTTTTNNAAAQRALERRARAQWLVEGQAAQQCGGAAAATSHAESTLVVVVRFAFVVATRRQCHVDRP